MTEIMTVPPGFEALNGLNKWNLATTNARTQARQNASKEELRAVYDLLLPYMGKILDACDAYPLGELPEDHRAIYNLALAMAEIAPHVEFYKGSPGVPYAFEESRFVAVHGDDETWRALPPNGRR